MLFHFGGSYEKYKREEGGGGKSELLEMLHGSSLARLQHIVPLYSPQSSDLLLLCLLRVYCTVLM